MRHSKQACINLWKKGNEEIDFTQDEIPQLFEVFKYTLLSEHFITKEEFLTWGIEDFEI